MGTSGLVVCALVEDTAEGTMVIDTGDIILDEQICTITNKTYCQKGNIVKFKGGLNTKLLHDYCEALKEKNAYQISHIGMGDGPQGTI